MNGIALHDHAGLRRQLNVALHFDAEYGASLSNHLPMTLTALARLGASDERLADFAVRYASRLHAAPPTQPWPAGTPWRDLLGLPGAWPACRSLFDDWIAHEGAPGVLEQVLPTLMQGVGAAAFHGPIRVAYALAANHGDELVAGLAYWACRWFACAEAPPQGHERDPSVALAVLAAQPLALPPRPLIAQRMAAAAAHPDWQRAVASWRADRSRTLPLLARLAAERHAQGGDFTALHLVTSAHAMQALLPWLDSDEEREAALGHYLLAFAAAWATIGTAPSRTPGATIHVWPWPELIARAIESEDEHAIKLVDSARELERTIGGAVWCVTASRAVMR